MDILTIVIKAEGSVAKLAAALGISPNTVHSWIRRESLPIGWTQALSLKYKKQIKAAQEEVAG